MGLMQLNTMDEDIVDEFLLNQLKMYCFLKDPKPSVNFKPENIYIEVTNKCNLKCMPCSRGNMKREVGSLSLDNFKSIINKLLNNGWTVPITIIGMGEPLLNKDVIEMIKYARYKKFNVALVSNSTLLNKQIIKELIDAKLNRYQTMFDSIEKEFYENFRHPAKYEKTMQNIIDLITANEEAGHPIWISIEGIVCDTNKKIEETESFWKSFPIDNFWSSPLYTLQGDSGLYEEAIKHKELDIPHICVSTFLCPYIAWNGDVSICALDCNWRFITGNIFYDSFDIVWNGEKAQELRSAVINWDIDFFKKHGFRCDLCNFPYIKNYTTKYYREYMPLRIRKKMETFLR